MKVCEKCGIMFGKGANVCPKCGFTNSANAKDKTVGIFMNSTPNSKSDTEIKINDSINIDVRTHDSNKTVGVYIDETDNGNIPVINKNESSNQIIAEEPISIGVKNEPLRKSEATVAEYVGNEDRKDNRTVPHFVGTKNKEDNRTVPHFVGNNDKEDNRTIPNYVGESAETEVNDIYIPGLQDEINEDEIIQLNNQNVISPAFSEEFKKRNKKPYAVFIAVEGVNLGKVYVAYEGVNTVGRSDGMDIVIEKDSSVSRESHCLIDCKTDGNVVLKSGKSKGITYLDNKPVFGECEIKDRSVVIVGKNKLMLIKICSDSFMWDVGDKN